MATPLKSNTETSGAGQPGSFWCPAEFHGNVCGTHVVLSACSSRPSSPLQTVRSGTHRLPRLVSLVRTHSNSHWSVRSFQRITSGTSGWHARHSSGAMAVPSCDVRPIPHTPPPGSPRPRPAAVSR